MTRRASAAALILAVLLVVLIWWWPNRATTAALPVGKLGSVSFAPYRRGQSPVTGVFPTTAQVAADIALLAPHVTAIRTYSASGGAADIPALAEVHGLKVWQGIWLGDDPTNNARDIAAGVALANRYPHVIDRVIVGNEVLLRHDLPVAALNADIDRVRAAVRQPVAYADVWEYWQKYPQVAAHIDQVLVHLLPYWEDRPLGVDRAVADELGHYRQMQALFPGKTVVVGETGWPSRGRWREDAAPGRVNQARFLRDFTAAASCQGIEYNLIEAFDQDWKVAQEGTVGAAWGLWTADRQPKFPLAVPVRDDPAWPWHASASILLGMLLLAARLHVTGRSTIGGLVLAMALGTALVWACVETVPVAYGMDRRTTGVVNLAGQAALAWILLVQPRHERLVAPLRNAFLITALYLQIMLLVDPRYRDFPTPAFGVPLVGSAWRLLGRSGASRDRLEALAAAGLTGTAIAGAVQEGFANRQSLVWCGAALLLAAPPLLAFAAMRLSRPALQGQGPRG